MSTGGWPSRAASFCFGTPALSDNEPNHTSLEARLTAIFAPTLESMGYEVVRIAVLGRQRPTVQIMVDRADGAAITVDDCETVSYQVGTMVQVDDPMPGAWTLEVSSPGIDRPLTRAKDWVRYAGHLARAETAFPVDGRKRFSGIVLGADETSAKMRLDDGKEVSLPLVDIRRAKLVLTDALIDATTQSPLPN